MVWPSTPPGARRRELVPWTVSRGLRVPPGGGRAETRRPRDRPAVRMSGPPVCRFRALNAGGLLNTAGPPADSAGLSPPTARIRTPPDAAFARGEVAGI